MEDTINNSLKTTIVKQVEERLPPTIKQANNLLVRPTTVGAIKSRSSSTNRCRNHIRRSPKTKIKIKK